MASAAFKYTPSNSRHDLCLLFCLILVQWVEISLNDGLGWTLDTDGEEEQEEEQEGDEKDDNEDTDQGPLKY